MNGTGIPIDTLAQSINAWANDVFPTRTDASMFLKLYGEIAELVEDGASEDEVADVFILFLDYAKRKNIDIEGAILRKMSVNVQRTWEVNELGVMRHVGT